MNFVFNFLNSSFGDEGERKRKLYRPRREICDDNYHKLFRFTRENVKFLADEFLEENFETRGGALDNVQKMEIFLRYMADPGYQNGVGEDVGVTQPTVCTTIWFVCQSILKKKQINGSIFRTQMMSSMKQKTFGLLNIRFPLHWSN